MRVAILGCGPAGLFAAHAAASLGHDIRIFSVKRKSRMFGAQYLHMWIPGLTETAPEYRVLYILNGTEAGYAEKVYGDVPPDFVSPAQLEGEQPAWDIRNAYDRAWDLYQSEVENVPSFNAASLYRSLLNGRLAWANLVISTIPAPDICRNRSQHDFLAREVWAIGDAPELDVVCPVTVMPETVVCDGTRDVGWYRASNIGGFRTAEWPTAPKPPYADVAKVSKVVRTNCNCWQAEGFWRTGRYGAWDKRLLTHHAYWSILDAFKPDR